MITSHTHTGAQKATVFPQLVGFPDEDKLKSNAEARSHGDTDEILSRAGKTEH